MASGKVRENASRKGQSLPTTLTPVAEGPEPTLRDVLLAINGLDNRVDSLELKIDSLSTRVDGLEVKIDGLGTRIDRLEGRMDRMDERMNHLDSRMERLDSRMERLETSVDVLGTRVTGLETAVGKMDDRITDMDKRITDLMIFEGANIKWLTERDSEIRNYLGKRHEEVNRHLIDTEMHLPRQRSAEPPRPDWPAFTP
jgi:chromosome segregation ATPase